MPRSAGASSACASTCSAAICWPIAANSLVRWSTCRPAAWRLIAPVSGNSASASSPMSTISAGSRARSRAVPEWLRHDDFGDAAQARQARRPTHLARQPQHPRPAGRSPSRPFRAAKIASARLIMPNGTNIGCGSSTCRCPAPASAPTSGRRSAPRHARQDPGPRGAPSGRRLRDRVHPAAASGLGRRERDRTVNAALHSFFRLPPVRAVSRAAAPRPSP